MPRFYKRITQRKRNTPEEIQASVALILQRGLSIRAVAKDTGISKTVLHKRVTLAKQNPDEEYHVHRNICNKQVFSEEQECLLRNYLKISSKMQYGLTKIDVRKLAYEYGSRLNIKYPETWNARKMAGKEWLFGFMHRSKDLSLRTSESTSLSRATSFNYHNVCQFFENILSAFSKTGIQPFNPTIFTEDDFLMSSVTDRPVDLSATSPKPSTSAASSLVPSTSTTFSPVPSTSIVTSPKVFTAAETILRSEDVNPYPKAPPRISKKGGRMKGKTRILTNTPEKNEIIILKTPKRNLLETKKVVRVTKRLRVAISSSSDDSDVPDKIVKDSSSDMDEISDEDIIDEDMDLSPDNANEGDFVLCKFMTDENFVHYAGKILHIDKGKYMLSFLRRRRTSYQFVYPDIEDKYEIALSDIVMTLPYPRINQGTARMARTHTFPVNIEKFNATLS